MPTNRHSMRSSPQRPRVPRRQTGGHRSRPGGRSRGLILLAVGAVLLAVMVLLAVWIFRGQESTPESVASILDTTPTPSMPPEASATPLPPTVTPTSLPTATPVPPTPFPPDIPVLQQFMLTEINNNRRANGLPELALDRTATTAGLAHAADMARTGYVSHINPEGFGPDYRYTLAGGLDAVRENVYLLEHAVGAGPTAPAEWQALVREIQKELLTDPASRENILAPEHTHVGLGLAYDPGAGRLAVAQEFVSKYVTLQPLLPQMALGQTITVTGRIDSRATNPSLTMAYAPLPKPRTIVELQAGGPYLSPAQTIETVPLTVDDNGRFAWPVTLNYQDQSGLYHLRVRVDTPFGPMLAAEVVVKAQ